MFLILLVIIPLPTLAMSPLELTPKQRIVQKIAYYSYHSGLAENLIVEVARCESGYSQSAVSPTNDIGVMQINLRYNGERAKKLGYDIYQEDDNIRFGIYLILHDGLMQSYSASSKCWSKTFPPTLALSLPSG